MGNSAPFRLNRNSLLLALISAAFAGQASAAAGRVEFALGGANIVGADGRTRTAARGTELDSGDVVRTNEGRVQVRMTDGSYISLQPNTEFGIKEYKFEGKADGTESAFYSLLKGAMRTVTGLIGRTNRNRYQVATPTATVGIRGTGGLIQVLNDGSTLVQGTSGIWFLANPSGSIDIPAGVAGLAPSDPKQPPKETSDVPTSGPAPLPPQEEFAQGDERTVDGSSVIIATTPQTAVLVSGDGFDGVLAHGVNCDGPCPQMDSGNGSAVFDSSGQLTSILFGLEGGSAMLEAGGSHAEGGTDGTTIAWGRWIGNVTTSSDGSVSFGPNEGLHYVVGVPTAVMPLSGTATYTLLGATSPTYVPGDVGSAPGNFAGTLNVDFGALTVGMNLSVTMPDASYAIGGAADISGNKFFGNADAFGGGNISISGTNCSCSCSARVDGFFAGTNAARAGLGYHIRNTANVNQNVVGAAAFQKQ